MGNIGIDATLMATNGKGQSRFLHQLIIALAENPTPRHSYIVYVNQRKELPDLPQVAHISYYPVTINNGFTWAVQQAIITRQQKTDLLFTSVERVPLFIHGDIALYLFELPGPRQNLNIASYLTFTTRLSAIISKLWIALSIRVAAHIIASSDATRQSLIEVYGIQASKTMLIYPGRTESFFPGSETYDKNVMRRRLGAPDGYVFHISSINDRRDNTPVALRAFHAALPDLPDGTKMVIGGRTDPDQQGLTPLIRELALENHLIWTGFIAEEDIVDVFRSADLYFDPSLYEGFGYQVLEAMSCGTPVVCSNSSSLPEVVGDAAITADPNDVAGLAAGLKLILNSDELSSQLRERGLVQARKFDWTETVEQLQAAFDKMTH